MKIEGLFYFLLYQLIMHIRFITAVAISLLLHGLSIYIFKVRNFPKPEPTPPIAIELLETQTKESRTKNNSDRTSSISKSQKRSSKSSRNSLRAFSPQPAGIPDAKDGHTGDFTAGVENGGWQAEDWGVRGGEFKQVEHYVKYRRLFEEINNLLFYPGPLANHDIGGTVNVRLTFDSRSHCDWSRSRVGGAHPYLRFYVTALIKKLCAFETIEHMSFKEKQFVDLSFAFVIVSFGEVFAAQEKKQGIVSNVLMFYRSVEHSPLEYRIGPLRGYLFAPVVALDFPWIFENWDKYVNGKDPFRDFKEAR